MAKLRFDEEHPRLVFTPIGGSDGWILESANNSGKGGATDARAAALRVGDDGRRREYRSILSFDTSWLQAAES